MSFNAIFNGAPSTVPSPSAPAQGLDVSTGAIWVTGVNNEGWIPSSGSEYLNVQKGLSAEPANFVVTVPATGIYQIFAYAISTVATSGDLPGVNAVANDADTGGSITAAVTTAKATSAANTVSQGSAIMNVAAGSTITLSGTGYATTTYNIKYRISFMG